MTTAAQMIENAIMGRKMVPTSYVPGM